MVISLFPYAKSGNGLELVKATSTHKYLARTAQKPSDAKLSGYRKLL